MRLNYADQEIWDNLTEAMKMSAKNIIAYKVQKQHNDYIIYTSKLQKHLNAQIKLTKDEN